MLIACNDCCECAASVCVTVTGCSGAGVGAGASVTLKKGGVDVGTCTTDGASSCCIPATAAGADYTLSVAPPAGKHYQTATDGPFAVTCGLTTSRTVNLSPESGYACFACGSTWLDPVQIAGLTAVVSDSAYPSLGTVSDGNLPGVVHETYFGGSTAAEAPCVGQPFGLTNDCYPQGTGDPAITIRIGYVFGCQSGAFYLDVYYYGYAPAGAPSNCCCPATPIAGPLVNRWVPTYRYALQSQTTSPPTLVFGGTPVSGSCPTDADLYPSGATITVTWV